MADFWKSQRTLVTGGAGFLGSYVVEKVRARGCSDLFVPARKEYDLTRPDAVRRMLEDARPTLVIHLAALVGGITEHQARPGEFFYHNLVMGALMLEEARRQGVPKLVAIGTNSSYPKSAPVPFREDDLWEGYPEETTAPYGLAKKMMLVQGAAYRRQYGFNSIHLLPVNLYGPRDHFDRSNAHVIAGLIRRCIETRNAGGEVFTVWGTGEATREFLYVEDAAEGIVLAAECYNESDPVNLGSGAEIRVRDLAALIASLCGFRGEIRFDPSKPDGPPRRCTDVSRAWAKFGFRAGTPLEEGLRRTIRWYENR